jgi:type VI secretion system secreted protein VgrG
VLGGMYNANMQPPFTVPSEQTKSGFRSRSTPNGGTGNFSEFSIDDKMGSELVFLHAEKDLSTEVENDQTLAVTGNRKVTVQKDETVTITGNRTETVNKQESITIAQGRSVTIQQGGDSLTVQAGDLTIAVSSGAISMQAMSKISLTVGSNSVTIDQSGITLNGIMIKAQAQANVQVQGQAMVQVQGPMVQVSADAMLMLKGGITMVN